MNAATLAFAREHADDDVRRTALKGCTDPDVDMPAALQQIAGRQAARSKLPTWADVDDILYPPHINMEQASGEAAARYKAELLAGLLGRQERQRAVLVDLTGGMGVDFSFMARRVGRAVYVDRNERLCCLARHNMPLLGLDNAEMVCAEAQQASHIAARIEPDDEQRRQRLVVFIDPARRDDAGRRTYALADCTPSVTELLPDLVTQCRLLLLKLSPMLDWHKAVADIEAAAPCRVTQVHVVATAGECKELLLVVEPAAMTAAAAAAEPLRVTCADDATRFCFTPAEEAPDPMPSPSDDSVFDAAQHLQPGSVLLVPGAAVMKGGGFAALSRRYGAAQLGHNSHLFIARSAPAGWPGRAFRIETVTGMNKRELKQAARGTQPLRANIAVRNFPLTAQELRQRLAAKDGGDLYIFATTVPPRNHLLLWCRKA